MYKRSIHGRMQPTIAFRVRLYQSYFEDRDRQKEIDARADTTLQKQIEKESYKERHKSELDQLLGLLGVLVCSSVCHMTRSRVAKCSHAYPFA